MLDLSIFRKFNFEYAPIGVKFAMTRPKDIPALEEEMAICEMLRHAQLNGAFYAAADNHNCKVGNYMLGQIPDDPGMVSGQIGPKIGVYQDARANRQIYLNMHKLDLGTCKYLLFSPLDGITFDPDLVILVAKPADAEIVLRAHGYRTGAGWNAAGTSVCGCSWLYAYPYLSGRLNMLVTGLHHGMKVRGTFPPGLLLMSIPYQVLPEVVNNLNEMEWDLPQYHWGKEAHLKRMKEVGQEIAAELRDGE